MGFIQPIQTSESRSLITQLPLFKTELSNVTETETLYQFLEGVQMRQDNGITRISKQEYQGDVSLCDCILTLKKIDDCYSRSGIQQIPSTERFYGLACKESLRAISFQYSEEDQASDALCCGSAVWKNLVMLFQDETYKGLSKEASDYMRLDKMSFNHLIIGREECWRDKEPLINEIKQQTREAPGNLDKAVGAYRAALSRIEDVYGNLLAE